MYVKKRFIRDNRQLDPFDKIRAYYIDGAKLSDKQEHKRQQYEQAHQLRLAGYSKDQSVRMLLEMKVANSQAESYRLCNNSERLFGDVAAANKEGLRVILTENFLRLFQKAEKADNLKEANRALENLAKLNSLFKEEDSINWDKIIIPVPVYSSNPATLFIKPKEIQEAELVPVE
jgi:hypothetical protein